MDKETREMARAEIRRMAREEAEEIRTEMMGIRWDLVALERRIRTEQRIRAWARGRAPLQGRKNGKRS
jgi:hypothetical protein